MNTSPTVLAGLASLALTSAVLAQGGVLVIGDRPSGTPPASGVVEVAGGDEFALARRSDGTLTAWGSSLFGETSAPAGVGHRGIACGKNHAVAIRSNFTLVAWGRNHLGQTSVPSGIFTNVAAAEDHCLAIRTNGELAAWGDPSDGLNSVPPGGYSAVACGDDFNLALRLDGVLVAWGSNQFGQRNVPNGVYGAIAATERTGFALRLDGALVAWGSDEFGLVTNRPTGPFVQIAAGEEHAIARRANGDVVAWGRGSHGELNVSTYQGVQTVGAGDGFSMLVGNGFPPAPPSPGFSTSVYWRRISDGANAIWRMQGGSLEFAQVMPAVADSSGWKFFGTGWFDHAPNDGDHTPEAVWIHGPSGTHALWSLEDDCSFEAKTLGVVAPGTGWYLSAIANVDGDLDDDLVWRNDLTGLVVAWIMDGDDLVGSSVIGQVPLTSTWVLETALDLDDDGVDDLIWWDPASGGMGWWKLAARTFAGATVMPYVVPQSSGWRIRGRGDYNDDFLPDLLWRQDDSGANGVWLMNGTGARSGVQAIPSVSPSSGWSLIDGNS